ncbi:MAG: RHS repeat-associated core domain-containing protein [Bacteroidales bacterium]|nr:RHS repeat-associated core domain-containing protein [Bacteroidales bacterium]
MAEILSYNPYRDMHNDVQFSAMFFGKNIQNIPLFNSTQTAVKEFDSYGLKVFTFTGKERDSETGFSYFGARYYDSDLMTGWLSVDPMADKYPNISPYAYCGWNPVKLVDPDGEKPRIYVELTGGTGHTFITVGEGKNTTVYTYGRYGEIGKESLGRFSPSGEGVLVRLTGDEAFKYISNQLEKNNASVYEFTNASDDKVAQYFDNIFNSKNKIPEKAKKSNFLSYDNSRVIDSYHLLSNNCTTKAIDGLRKGVDDKDLFSTINTPQKLKYRLESLTVPSLINYIRDNVIGYDINIQKKSAQEILDEWK